MCIHIFEYLKIDNVYTCESLGMYCIYLFTMHITWDKNKTLEVHQEHFRFHLGWFTSFYVGVYIAFSCSLWASHGIKMKILNFKREIEEKSEHLKVQESKLWTEATMNLNAHHGGFVSQKKETEAKKICSWAVSRRQPVTTRWDSDL